MNNQEEDLNVLSDLIQLNVMQFTTTLITKRNDNYANLYSKAQDPTNKAILISAMKLAKGN